jgi:DNA-binding transcriptional LysR family regulator
VSVKHIEFLADPTAGEVRIGASVAMAAGFIAAVTDRLSRRHPKIAFNVLCAERGSAILSVNAERHSGKMTVVSSAREASELAELWSCDA